MIINGEKWACETCIKGHRATHCKHTDRELVMIKKKGRPSTQCKRCRELRIVRQLHVKCDCEDQGSPIAKKNSNSTISLKRKIKSKALRPLAPKQENNVYIPDTPLISNSRESTPNTYSPTSNDFISSSPSLPFILSTTNNIQQPPIEHHNEYISPTTTTPSSCCSSKPKTPSPPSSGCCSNKKDTKLSSCCENKPTEPLFSSASNSPVIESVPFPDIPPPSSCCGPPSKNQQGEIIRVVTCRCGDSCACIGCDAHPSRAMKESTKDVYIGFDDYLYNNSKNLSISEICNETTMDHPSSILSDEGVLLCGCGCLKALEDCTCCFNELCDNPSAH